MQAADLPTWAYTIMPRDAWRRGRNLAVFSFSHGIRRASWAPSPNRLPAMTRFAQNICYSHCANAGIASPAWFALRYASYYITAFRHTWFPRCDGDGIRPMGFILPLRVLNAVPEQNTGDTRAGNTQTPDVLEGSLATPRSMTWRACKRRACQHARRTYLLQRDFPNLLFVSPST